MSITLGTLRTKKKRSKSSGTVDLRKRRSEKKVRKPPFRAQAEESAKAKVDRAIEESAEFVQYLKDRITVLKSTNHHRLARDLEKAMTIITNFATLVLFERKD